MASEVTGWIIFDEVERNWSEQICRILPPGYQTVVYEIRISKTATFEKVAERYDNKREAPLTERPEDPNEKPKPSRLFDFLI